MTSVFIFRRDLRIEDNTALNECYKNSKKIILCFFMTPTQLTQKNDYKSQRCIYFMYESIKEINQEIKGKLNCYYEEPEKCLEELLKNKDVKNVYVNEDYTKYSKDRDLKLKSICDKHKVSFHSKEDILLHPVNTIKTKTGKVYSKFTPFYNNAKKLTVRKPEIIKMTLSKFSLYKTKYSVKVDQLLKYTSTKGVFNGGRKYALQTINNIKQFNDYPKKHDILMYNTTHLSAHIKFGTVSIRECYYKMKPIEALTRQLHWREFYANIGNQDNNFLEKRIYQPKSMKWSNKYLEQWKQGNTGIPIVDASMRELNQTGFCHNRGRLIASGIAKLMLLDWRECEKYYSQQLIDYDIFNNHYNWNWSYSFGAFATPWFRIFNPYTQGKRFDKQGDYIKKWIPELKEVPPKDLHKWEEVHQNYNVKYPKPILNYKKQRQDCLDFYKKMYS